MVELLLRYDADPHLEGGLNNVNALTAAAMSNNADMVKLLLDTAEFSQLEREKALRWLQQPGVGPHDKYLPRKYNEVASILKNYGK